MLSAIFQLTRTVIVMTVMTVMTKRLRLLRPRRRERTRRWGAAGRCPRTNLLFARVFGVAVDKRVVAGGTAMILLNVCPFCWWLMPDSNC